MKSPLLTQKMIKRNNKNNQLFDVVAVQHKTIEGKLHIVKCDTLLTNVTFERAQKSFVV